VSRTRIREASAADRRSWWLKNRWLVLRRTSQLGLLGLFLLGPLAGIWIIKGNLNSSMTLDVLPLTDPFVLLQSWLAGRHFGSQALLGALIIAAFYFLAGGRAYCAWVCPVNIVTDLAHWLRQRLGLRGKTKIKRNTRYWLLGVSLLVSLAGGYVAWELVNPVSVLHRGLLFGIGTGWLIILAVFLLDLAVSQRGWCGHLCPVGAFYSLLGTHSLVRVRADQRQSCNKCMDCFDVCPEPQVIRPALFGGKDGIGPLIDEPNCTNCGRCIDVCSKEVFVFGTRFGASGAEKDFSGPNQAGFTQTLNFNSENMEQEEART
jgi:ferredoxin-type protein NapH